MCFGLQCAHEHYLQRGRADTKKQSAALEKCVTYTATVVLRVLLFAHPTSGAVSTTCDSEAP